MALRPYCRCFQAENGEPYSDEKEIITRPRHQCIPSYSATSPRPAKVWLDLLYQRRAGGSRSAAQFISASQDLAGSFLQSVPAAPDLRMTSEDNPSKLR